MAASATSIAKVQKLYIAYFGRPADPTGLEFWASKVDAANGDESMVIAGFSASNESQALFGGSTTAQKVNAIYRNLFDRDAESAGLQFWVQKIDSGEVTQAQAAYTILNGAGAGDATAVANKLAAANAFTAAINTTAEILGYSGAAAAQIARTWLGGVNAEQAKLTTALGTVDATVNNVVNAQQNIAGQTFTLTTGEDTLVGTTGNDTFSASIIENNIGDGAATLQGFDSLDGGAGADTLKATLLDDVTVDSTSVETYELKGGDDVGLTVGVAADVTTLVNKMVGETTINGAAALATITQNGDENLTVNGMKATTVSLSVEDADNTVELNAAGTAKAAQTLDVNFNGDLTVTSDLTETLTVTANGAGTFDATDDAVHDIFTLTDAGNVVTATIKGTGDIDVSLATDTNKLTTFDASALVGGVDAALSGAATSVLATVKGGQGDDDLSVANLKDGGSIELGAGNDTLTTTGAKGAYTIDGGAGNDDITVNNVVVNKAAVVNGGDGDDIITIDDAVDYTATGTTLTVNGGAGNDTVIAGELQDAKSTVNFDGGDGDADVIRITDGLDITSAKRFANFEVIDVTGAAAAEAYDLSRELSLNAVLVNGAAADAALNNVQAGTSLEVRDGGDATIVYNLEGYNPVTGVDGTGDADAISVLLTQDDSANVADGANATVGLVNDLNLTAEGIETVNINATAQVGTNTKGTTSTADDVAVAGSDYVNNVTLTSETVETITVSGNAFVTLNVADAAALTLIDASANTGGVKVDFFENGTEITFLGGSGDDVVIANNEVAVIDAGVGADRITTGGMTTVVYGAVADSKLGLNTAGTAVDFSAMDTIDGETFENYDVALQTGDRIDLTAFNFTAGRIEAVEQKGDIADLTALVENANNEGKDFFLDATVDRAVVLASFGGDNYVFVDANKDGNFAAADDLVILVGTAVLSVDDFMFQA